MWLLDRWLYLNVCVTKVGVSVQAWGQAPYASCSFWVCSDKLESVSDKKPAMAHTEDTNTPTSAAYGIWGQHQSKIELTSDCCCLYGNNCGPPLFDNTHKWAASLWQRAPFLQKIKMDMKWLTLMNSSMLGSLSELCRSAILSPKSFCFVWFKKSKCSY